MDRRIVAIVKSLRPYGWKWQWTLVLIVVTLGAVGFLNPDTAETVKSLVTVSAMLGVGWLVWQLMSHE